jgi:hypothetical protein
MDPTHTHWLLEKKETFPTFVNLDGMNGVTTENTLPTFPSNRKSWGECLDQQGENATKCAKWVLKGNGKVVPRRSVRPLNPSEIRSEVEIIKRNVFDELIERTHGTSINPPKPMKGRSDTEEPDDTDSDADTEPVGELPDIEDILDSTGKVLNQQPMWNKMISADIILQQSDKLQRGKV